jgi:hypothetical protein
MARAKFESYIKSFDKLQPNREIRKKSARAIL